MMLLSFSLLLLLCAFCVAYDYPDCAGGPMAGSPICDPTAPINVRANDFLSKLNVSDKISRIYSGFGVASPAIPRLGIPELQWINDALHGITGGPNFQYTSGNGPYNSSTSFPSPINFAATFDDSLAFGLGSFIAIEARAFTNANRGGVDLWTPNINPFRDPRWGRGQEVPGEDPYAIGRYAFNFVRGMQGGEDPRYYKAVADCKHYAAYDLEPGFEACARDGAAGSVMCSYNALNGIPTCANNWLLQTVLREAWGYNDCPDCWVVSDCDAVSNVYDSHHYVNDPALAAALSLRAGTDLDCGGFYKDHLPAAYTNNMITEADLNVAVLRLTKSLIRIGYFDSPKNQPYRQYDDSMVNSAAAHALSRRTALESITLLKNYADVLPIITNGAPVKIAVIGPLATDTYFIQGNYRGKPPYVVTVLQAITAEPMLQVTYVYGCDVNSQNTSGFAAAVRAAQGADYTIYVGGMTEHEEAEGNDRTSLAWPGVQQQLILQLGGAAKNLIVLVMGGGQIDHTQIKNSMGVGAILWIGYPSMFGGSAIADVIFGRYSPSGRLVTTSYPADYISLSMFDMNLRPNNATGNPGRTYKWYSGTPVYPFGYGLSYSTFEYKFLNNGLEAEAFTTEQHVSRAKKWTSLQDPAEHLDADRAPFITYAVNVTNTGNVRAATSVLLFVSGSPPDSPLQSLIGYVYVSELNPGQTVTRYFDVSLKQLAYVDNMGDRWMLPGDYCIFVGYAGHAEAEHTFTMTGEPVLLHEFPRQPENNKVYLETSKAQQTRVLPITRKNTE